MKTACTKLGLLSCVLAVFLMSGCKADVDLNNIDTHTEYNFGFAVPIGSMRVAIQDILGDSLLELIKEDENGQLYLIDTFHSAREYHALDLSQYITTATKYCNVHDVLDDEGVLWNNQFTTRDFDVPMVLNFPFSLKLEGINEDEYYERLDSALIKHANFKSCISTRNLGIKEEWVNKVEIVLSDVFHRPQGNVVTVFGGNDFKYNQDIPININEFSINLMKNSHPKDPAEYLGNVKDSITLNIQFSLTIPRNTTVQVPNDAAFQYNLELQFIDYEAVWGYFKPSNQMHDEGVIDLYKEWEFWDKFKDAVLPFADPVINMYTTTGVAGALKMTGEYLYAAGMDGDTVYATFDGRRTFIKYFKEGVPSPYYKYDDGYLPLKSDIGDIARTYVLFDNTPARGHIDQMFTISPKALGYKFVVEFNRDETPQLRITPNTMVDMMAELIAPLKFQEGFKVKYQSIITDVNISQISIDSILASTPGFDSIKDGQLALILNAYNYIPLHLQGIFRFLDASGNPIMDPLNPTQPLHFSDQDTVHFNVPEEFEFKDGKYYAKEPGRSAFALYITKENSYLLEQIKAIQFEILIDSKDLEKAFEEYKDFNIDLLGENYIRLGVGIATNITAIYDYTKK